MKRLQLLLLRRGRSVTSELSTSQVIITFCITTRFISPLFVWVRYVQTRTLVIFYSSVCVFLPVFITSSCWQFTPVHSRNKHQEEKSDLKWEQLRSAVKEISTNVQKQIFSKVSRWCCWCLNSFESSAVCGNFLNVIRSLMKLIMLTKMTKVTRLIMLTRLMMHSVIVSFSSRGASLGHVTFKKDEL